MKPKITLDSINELLIDIAIELRKQGERIGPSQIVTAYEVTRDYMVLVSREWLDPKELARILKASWPTIKKGEEFLEEAIVRFLYNKNIELHAKRFYEELLNAAEELNIKPGSVVIRKEISSIRKKKDRIKAKKAYAKLRQVGAIRRIQGKERLVDDKTLKEIAYKLAREGYKDLNHAARSSTIHKGIDDLYLRIESRLGFEEEALSDLPEHLLIKIGNAALKKHDHTTAKMVAETLKERILKGEKIKNIEKTIDLLKKTKMLEPDIIRELLMSGSFVKEASPETLASIIDQIDEEKAASLIASYIKESNMENFEFLMKHVDPKILWSARPPRDLKGSGRELFQAAIYAAKALKEARKYAETLDPARADMAEYYANKSRSMLSSLQNIRIGKISVGDLEKMLDTADGIIESVESLTSDQFVDSKTLELLLLRMDYEQSIEVFRQFYRHSSETTREILINTLARVLSRLASRKGLSYLPRKQKRTFGHRMEIRRTIYNTLRYMPRPLVFVSRMRTKEISLAVDVSSSMKPYASWTLLVASLFYKHVRKIVLFSHEQKVYYGPFTRRDIARILLETEFYGRTNISSAIRSASDKARRIVVVTDLEQTIKDTPPWLEVRSIVNSGKSIVFIVPETHDRYTRQLLENEGARVLVARTPYEAARRLLSVAFR